MSTVWSPYTPRVDKLYRRIVWHAHCAFAYGVDAEGLAVAEAAKAACAYRFAYAQHVASHALGHCRGIAVEACLLQLQPGRFLR